MTNKEIQEQEIFLLDMQDWLHRQDGEGYGEVLENIYEMIDALPVRNSAEDKYFHELENEWRASLPRMSIKEELDTFDAYDLVKDLYYNTERQETKNKLKAYFIVAMDKNLEVLGETVSDRVSKRDIQAAKEVSCHAILRNAGIEVKKTFAVCQFHNERTPSMKIYENNTFYCFGCGAAGDSISLYRGVYGVDFKQAVRALI